MIEWKKSYEFGIQDIDEQHHHFIDICNELLQTVNDGSERDRVGLVADKLMSYAKMHFDTEEEYFRKFGFEGAAAHVAQHQLMYDQLKFFMERFSAGGEIALPMFGFATDWLFTHIRIYDQAYVDDFRKRGLI